MGLETHKKKGLTSMNLFVRHVGILLVLTILVLVSANAWALSHSRETPVVQAVKKVSPAVVNISSQYEVIAGSNPFFNRGLDPFFDSFFKDFFEPHYQRRYEGHSLGSGVIIDGRRGYILTNEHVIARSGKVRVVLRDDREFDAELVGAAPDFDLAVLKIEADGTLPAIEMGDSDDLMIGETVIAIGNPFGFSHTVTTGVISALNRSVQASDRTYRNFIQTDASINPGNSGGPLLNINGNLIGINTAIHSEAQGIGFAIPINRAKRVVNDLIKYGEIHIPWLGLFVQDLDPKLVHYFSIPQGEGVLVSEVTLRSPAQEAGVRAGDVITALGGRRVTSKETYHALIRDFSEEDVISLTIWKDGRAHITQVLSRTFPKALAEDLGYRLLGVRVEAISTALRYKFNIRARDGVVMTQVREGSYLLRIGARPGDILRKMNEMMIRTVDDFKEAVVKYRHKEAAVMLIQRGGQQYYVTVKADV